MRMRTSGHRRLRHGRCWPDVYTYVWAMTHRAWNALMHALHGNTAPEPAAKRSKKTPPAFPNAPQNGKRIAVWHDRGGPTPQWWTATAISTVAGADGVALTTMRTHVDGCDHPPMDMDQLPWQPYIPNSKPHCPACGSHATKVGGGGGKKVGKAYNTEYYYVCCACDRRMKAPHSCYLRRENRTSPQPTEPHVAVLVPDAEGPPRPLKVPPPARPAPAALQYRAGAEDHPCLGDTKLLYVNAQGLGKHGAARAFLRDIAFDVTDVVAVSEAGCDEAQIRALSAGFETQGHRVWGAPRVEGAAHQMGTGTLIAVASTVAARPGDGLVYAKPDGKAAMVAITIAGRPVYLLAAHLPANGNDGDRVEFLETLTDDVIAATEEHALEHGGQWRQAHRLWAGDLNLVLDPRDEEAPGTPPGPEAVAALEQLDEVMGGAIDVYRHLFPAGREYTHGKAERADRRRLDTFRATGRDLTGASGVVAVRHVAREALAFSYVSRAKTGAGVETFKQGDHDAVQIVFRATTFKAPPPVQTIRRSTLRAHGVRAWIRDKLAGMQARNEEAGPPGNDHGSEAAFADLHTELKDECIRRQRQAARQNGMRRASLCTIVARLEKKLTATAPGDKYLASASNLQKRRQQLQTMCHNTRRRRDAEEAFEEQMLAEGAGKAAQPRTRAEPVTRLDVPLARGDGSTVEQLTTQKGVLDGSTRFWRTYLDNRLEPTPQAAADRDAVLSRLRHETEGALPTKVRDALTIESIIKPKNIEIAIRNLARGSTSGCDDMPLEFYIENAEQIAPLLSELYKELLADGQLSVAMRQAILSPIFKNKGEKHDPTKYRPISVTTLEYRILAKCIAQRLNLAVSHIVGDPQTGFSPGRKYDENVNLIRDTVRDINGRRPHHGGLMLFLDNEKAFDRLQHDFMFKVLQAFNLPTELVHAVKTLYNGANVAVKLNGEVGRSFTQMSGVKQGCPLSPLLYILVQEVQMRMIRQDPEIEGIPIPDHDGRDPVSGSETSTLRERGLVDDTMVGVRTPASIPPLMRVLSRFEAFSHHKMNVEKTIILLLGEQRAFDIGGGTEPARLLRERGVTQAHVHDITSEGTASLPDKWHGVVLGREEGVAAAWDAAVTQAQQTAARLQASSLPIASRGRLAQATGRIMGKALATLKFTAPHSQGTIDKELARLQKAASGLVLGRTRPLTAAEAQQPRTAFGIGLLDAKAHMQATWASPLVETLRGGSHRPYKHYYAQAARLAYPEMDMGRELLGLRLTFDKVARLPPSHITGEARQAFKALGAMPPFEYLAPEDGGDDTATTPRENMRAEDLRRQPLLLNPILECQPKKGRAEAWEEEEMIRWARAGITRVEHVLTSSGSVATNCDALVEQHPRLLDQLHGGYAKANVTKRLKDIKENLRRWRHTLSRPVPKRVQQGEWRSHGGRVLRAQARARRDDTAVPATVYREEPSTGRLTATGEDAQLPAARADSTPCHTRELVVWDEEEEPDLPVETPAELELALAVEYRHELLAPPGQPPVPDARLLAWRWPTNVTMPATASEEERRRRRRAGHVSGAGPKITCVDEAKTRDVRLTLTAQKWEDPRVFVQGGRYECMVSGLTGAQREQRIHEIARGTMHWAIPSEEKLHLLVTAHHGHKQGKNKCKGEEAFCAACLKAGRRVEEGALHEHHECPELAREVWARLACTWTETTGEALDVSDPLLTVMGMRPKGEGPGKEMAEALEPAWRLLHSVALRQIHGARNRIHAAYHAKTPREPKRATSRHVLREIKLRMQTRIEYEHARAEHRAIYGRSQGARAQFQRLWVLTGVADMQKAGPRLNILRARGAEGVAPGVHIRTVGAWVKKTASQPPAAGWVVQETDVGQDGTESGRLRARGAVPTQATHGASVPPHALTRQTEQGAQQDALRRGISRAGHHLAKDGTTGVTITVGSITTMQRIQRAAQQLERAAGARAAPPPDGGAQNMTQRERLNQYKRTRGEPELRTEAKSKAKSSTANLEIENCEKLAELRRRYPDRLRLRAPANAVKITLRQQAAGAARLRNLDVLVAKIAANGCECSERSVSQWDDTRVWDPGD